MRSRRQSRPRAPDCQGIRVAGSELPPADCLTVGQALRRERPYEARDQFLTARRAVEENWLVGQVVLLQAAFCNFQPRYEGLPAKWRERNPDALAALDRYVVEAWEEWLTLDNVVTFWRPSFGTTPVLLKPEQCTYANVFGRDVLKARLGYSEADLKALESLSEAERRRYLSEFELDPTGHDEQFRVLTRTARGRGFGKPRLYSVFRTLMQAEHMEFGEAQLAFGGRSPILQDKIGFEVKSGSNAMRQADYLWKKKKAEAIIKQRQGVRGLSHEVVQFDQATGYVWVDPKAYDARKWETIQVRLCWWGGPLAFMMLSRTSNPFLLPLLKTFVLAERRRFGGYLDFVINAGFDLPKRVHVAWGDRCFTDLRLAWDMVKALMTQGPLSLTTALVEGGFDPAAEADLKVEEANPKRRKELLPVWDAAHGAVPGEPPPRAGAPGAAGRPRSSAEPAAT